ncbi:ATP25 [Candida pseudojiufengensis]|uniref:ATP25 n=1 Tax=Candida pseudojiufengensis TaxID=497109 RepID=UPI00222454B4|nr:ATP25 [Candida pseudojiufengensis]KAI5963600.1 ATP25 [Candida pseudojiufengensis]
MKESILLQCKRRLHSFCKINPSYKCSGPYLQSNFTTTIRAYSSPKDNDSIPWYLRDENTSKAEPMYSNEIIEFPKSSSQALKDFSILLKEKYGLIDFIIIDLSLLPSDHPKSTENQSHEKYIIVTSGKSEKHIYKASYDLKQYMKQKFGYTPRIDGMVSNSVSATTRRRLAKRARQGPPATHSTFGIGPNSWVRCETGIDGAVLHILSPERRSELRIEEIYGEVYDLAETIPYNKYRNEDKNDIFFGLRQGFHTSTRHNNNLEDLNIVPIKPDFLLKEVENRKSHQQNRSSNENLETYNKKFYHYKILTFTNPSGYSIQDAENVLLDKHSSFHLAAEDIDWNQEIVDDVIRYMELLLDVPSGLNATEKLSKLSNFLSKIAAFKTDELHFFAVDKFQTLLWSLTCNEYIQTDGAKIDSIIQSKGEGIEVEHKPCIQDARSAQNVRELIRQINFSHRGQVPLWLREHMLCTYANCKNWVYFWKEWKSIMQSLVDPKDFLQMFTKVVILLTIINDKIALRDFFNNYWNNPDGPSFLTELSKNENQFSSTNEELALRKASTVIRNRYPTSKWSELVSNF